jgi:hypothetical protein
MSDDLDGCRGMLVATLIAIVIWVLVIAALV